LTTHYEDQETISILYVDLFVLMALFPRPLTRKNGVAFENQLTVRVAIAAIGLASLPLWWALVWT
jgi:hypothetical protein